MSRMTSVNLKIMDKEFKVKCTSEEKNKIADAADLVNHKIDEVKKHGKSVGSDRIAIMTALNLASEYLMQKDIVHQYEKTNSAKISKLLLQVEQSLQELKEPQDKNQLETLKN